MRKTNVPLRLQESLPAEARRVGGTEEDFFRERAERANMRAAKKALKRAGRGNPPVSGDEIE